MANKDKMVDYPGYDPDARIPFPPGPGASPFGKSTPRKPEPKPEKKPYYETYDADLPAPDPSQTTPGAPDIRDPDTRLEGDADLGKLSPDVDLKE